jgi:hypothetical protein
MATVKTVVTTETILRKKRQKRCSADIPAQRDMHLNVLEGVLGDVTPAGKGPKPDDDNDGGANVQQSAVPNRYWCPCSHFCRSCSVNGVACRLCPQPTKHLPPVNRPRSPKSAARWKFDAVSRDDFFDDQMGV